MNSSPAAALLDLDGVRERLDAVRDAAAALRFHEGLRRRVPEAAAESRVRGAGASARLDGARVPDDVVREYVVGARPWPRPLDPTERVLRGAVQAVVEAEHLGPRLRHEPRLVLARLHTVAAAHLAPADELGRPRTDERCAELVDVPLPTASDARERLEGVVTLLGSLDGLPAPLLAALAHAEVAVARPFGIGNGLVARALERLVLAAGGTDPTWVSVPEAGLERAGHPAVVGSLAAYATGTRDGVALWLRTALEAYAAGVREGVAIADAVRAGRLERREPHVILRDDPQGVVDRHAAVVSRHL